MPLMKECYASAEEEVYTEKEEVKQTKVGGQHALQRLSKILKKK